jgi:hypothetical protein
MQAAKEEAADAAEAVSAAGVVVPGWKQNLVSSSASGAFASASAAVTSASAAMEAKKAAEAEEAAAAAAAGEVTRARASHPMSARTRRRLRPSRAAHLPSPACIARRQEVILEYPPVPYLACVGSMVASTRPSCTLYSSDLEAVRDDGPCPPPAISSRLSLSPSLLIPSHPISSQVADDEGAFTQPTVDVLTADVLERTGLANDVLLFPTRLCDLLDDAHAKALDFGRERGYDDSTLRQTLEDAHLQLFERSQAGIHPSCRPSRGDALPADRLCDHHVVG